MCVRVCVYVTYKKHPPPASRRDPTRKIHCLEQPAFVVPHVLHVPHAGAVVGAARPIQGVHEDVQVQVELRFRLQFDREVLLATTKQLRYKSGLSYTLLTHTLTLITSFMIALSVDILAR